MLPALAIAGQGAAAWTVLRGYPALLARGGAAEDPVAAGQALWTLDRVARLAPDPAAEAALWPAVEAGAARLAAARHGRRPPRARGLLPASAAGGLFGPPDYYYWDNLWALAGLEAASRIAGRLGHDAAATAWCTEAVRLAGALERSLARAATDEGALPAAPGRGADAGMAGTLAAWWPLELFPADDPRLPASLAALDRVATYQGLYYRASLAHGWSPALSMLVAACLLRTDPAAAWGWVDRLLGRASATYTWPGVIDPRTGGGSAGDGAQGWASAAWILLVRDLLLYASGDRLMLLAGLPADWLARDGALALERAPTPFGPITLTARWDAAARTLDLAVTPESGAGPPGGYVVAAPALRGTGEAPRQRLAPGAQTARLTWDA